MRADRKVKTLVQCDFDGTITQEDISFLILDNFADGDWRKLLNDYQRGIISVGNFNTAAFNMVKADKETLREFVEQKTRIREGFPELLALCREMDYRFVIVSNGLEFYINTILQMLGIENIEVFAAKAEFNPSGIKAKYVGPDGSELQNDYKVTYIRHFLEDKYYIIYIGNGASDVHSARLANQVFATDTMLAKCKKIKLECTPFNNLNDVVEGIKAII
jgi:2-hydroxy-3-keto-5-methylthiopentenyl-1-phosphate phosphatase